MSYHPPLKFKTKCNNKSAYIARTSINIQHMAEGLMRYLIDKELDSDVRVYYRKSKQWICLQPRKYSSDGDAWIKVEHTHRKKTYTWYERDDLNLNNICEYHGDYLCVTSEGELYDELNYAFETGDYTVQEELNNYFSHWGLYYEQGYAWSFALYEI